MERRSDAPESPPPPSPAIGDALRHRRLAHLTFPSLPSSPQVRPEAPPYGLRLLANELTTELEADQPTPLPLASIDASLAPPGTPRAAAGGGASAAAAPATPGGYGTPAGYGGSLGTPRAPSSTAMVVAREPSNDRLAALKAFVELHALGEETAEPARKEKEAALTLSTVQTALLERGAPGPLPPLTAPLLPLYRCTAPRGASGTPSS